MTDYIALPLVDDPDALLEVGVDYIENAITGFVARPGNVETVLLEANSQIAAEVVQQASQPPPVAFAYAGEALYGIPPHAAVPATATATVTWSADTPASMVAAQSLISVPHPSGEFMIFTTDEDVVALDGGGDVLVGVTALEAGADGNGAFGVAELVDVIDGVQQVVVSAASGGVDDETPEDYLDRLADALTLLAPRPILPPDFATMARQVPGVGRTLALNLYQPGTADNIVAGQPGGPLLVEGAPVNAGAGVNNVERCVTTVVTGLAGVPPTQALMHTAWQTLDGAREVNFLAYVIAPHYTSVDVQATVKAYPGYTAVDVEAAAELMLARWLDPGLWGSQPSSTADTVDQWALDTYARIYEAVDWINRADGVYYVKTVQLRKHGDPAWSAVDVLLPGVAPLPVLGDVAITVEL
jgi:uncharacterized phage protein gp47/JayE